MSLLRGPWEIRLVRVDELAPGLDAADLRLRVSGWPVSGEDVTADTTDSSSAARAAHVVSHIRAIGHEARPSTVVSHNASPLGTSTVAPLLTSPVRVGEWMASAIELARTGRPRPDLAGVSVAVLGGASVHDGAQIAVSWPDGLSTSHVLSGNGHPLVSVPDESILGSR